MDRISDALHHSHPPATPGQMSEYELHLPFEIHMLVPFQIAWRATPSTLPHDKRAALVAEQMSAWGLAFGKAEAANAHDALSEVFELDKEWTTAAATPLVPPETRCCLCHADLQVLEAGATVSIWSVSGHPKDAKEFRKKCTRCTAVHHYSCVVAPRFWAVIHVSHKTKAREVERIALGTALAALAVGVTYVTADAASPVLTLVRAFDHPLQHFHDLSTAQRFVADELPSLPGHSPLHQPEGSLLLLLHPSLLRIHPCLPMLVDQAE